MEIKMAEIFGSEGMKNLHLRGALVLTGPEAEAAVLAVKNHDRLTNEVSKLREALSLTMNALSLFTDHAIDISQRVSEKSLETLVCVDDILDELELEKGDE
ncbi:hypothetical protein [Vibrio tarriae]|uniref:hypothetical protein n=1 Tax=Vibrio tarriae TaxID=2014742 RepID=UPI000DE2F51F|nr:hypothetical protein [Vibrio tarriae]RBM30538.1 hypothetical protein DLR58_16905 [Vibrio tarriae]